MSNKSFSKGSAKVTGCDKCCFTWNKIILQIINIVDFGFGGVLIGFFAYLYGKLGAYKTNDQAVWIEYSCCILGILFLLESFLSCCSIASEGFRWGMVLARWLSYLLTLLSLILGCVAFAKKKEFFNFLDDNLGSTISSETMNTIKNFYLFIAIALFGSFVIHVIQIFLSFRFREQSKRIDGEFGNLVAEEQAAYKERMQENTTLRTEKYNDLRAHYKQKYNKKDSTPAPGPNDLERNSQF